MATTNTFRISLFQRQTRIGDILADFAGTNLVSGFWDL
jgi:hypothetical protein